MFVKDRFKDLVLISLSGQMKSKHLNFIVLMKGPKIYREQFRQFSFLSTLNILPNFKVNGISASKSGDLARKISTSNLEITNREIFEYGNRMEYY